MEMLDNMTISEALDKEKGIDFKQFNLILIRGVPGSGKSTMAKNIAKSIASEFPLTATAQCYETDDFFHGPNGYVRDVTKIGLAHAWNQNCVQRALNSGFTAIVANTFTREFEMIAYLKMVYVSSVLVIDMYTQFGNVHGVPAEHVEKMKNRFVPVDQLKFKNDFDYIGVKIYG